MVAALAAFWVGLLYDEQELDTAEQVIDGWRAETRQHLYRDAARLGLRARVENLSLREISQMLLDPSARGLRRRAHLNPLGQDESVYLEPLRSIAASGRSRALQLLNTTDLHDALIRNCDLT